MTTAEPAHRVHLRRVRKTVPDGPDLGRDFQVSIDGRPVRRVVAVDWHLDGNGLGTVQLTIEASLAVTDGVEP